MPRTLNADTVASMMAVNANVIGVWIAEITHEYMTEVYRIADNREDITGPDGETYTGLGFEFIPPEESEDGFKTAKITLNNVERWFTEKLREMSTPFMVSFSFVTGTDLSASPPVFGNTEISILPMRLSNIEYDMKSVTGTLSFHEIEDRSYPEGHFTPEDFPGIY